MAYNPYGASPYGRPPGFGSFSGVSGAPPGMGPPPGMAPPPGMSAPGTAPPPGLQQANTPQATRPTGLPASFQGPVNMPNINFSAPVIRLGTGPTKPNTPISVGPIGPMSMSSGGKSGLGATQQVMDAQREALRVSMLALVPPTKEEIVRTIFVGGITEGAGGDEGVERILSTAGRLRRWDRAVDADGKECSFGFAQYDDVESLATAVEVLKDIEIPTKKQLPSDGVKREGEEEKKEIEKSKLLVFVDDNSLNYLENYQASKGDDATAEQTRLDAAKMGLKGVLYELFHPPMFVKAEEGGEDVAMQDANGGENVEVVNIPLAVDDELADIPAEMRETVAGEIAAFRDRSIRRDIERLKREEEMELAERQRNGAPRPSRLASPGPQIPSGPAAGTNNIPLGPRGVPNAPSGPKSQGAQIPRDYQAGVKFVNGSGINGASGGEVYINREDEDSDASDEELERRRIAKKEAEEEKQYLDQERRWLNRERSRTAAVQREKEREDEDAANTEAVKQKMAQRLREWDDDAEATRKTDPYYVDRSMWVRNRATFRAREIAADDRDRVLEEREKQREKADREQARGLADSFLDRQAEEMEARSSRMAQQPFKLSLGAAAQKAQKAAPPRRTVAEVEGLLEDEEDAGKASKRTLIPIKFDPSTATTSLTDEERDQASKQLAAEIPVETEPLWAWEVKWDYVDDTIIVEKLRPFVERKIVEYLGVQEQLLVEVVEEHLRTRGKPQDLVTQLEGALDEESEVLVKKLWRMMIYFSESEKRGISA